MDKKRFYITTTLPYVNAEPHIGFALEIVQADVLARLATLSREEVVFNFGTDEHGQKIYQKALELGQDPKAYCDESAARFDKLKKALNLSYTNFVRTTDEHHIKAAQEFWKRCDAAGDIYKKNYRVKYCVGCELEKTDSELVEGKCPIHPNKDLEVRDEENYFFRFSKYQQPLWEFYGTHPDFVMPEERFREIKAFVKAGLEDFSISRLKKKMPWGIEIPGDSEQVMYVWFDALINYISTLGWPENIENFKNFWPGVQVAGKDNLRQQSAMWQAMLMSAGLPNSKQIFIHGFMTKDGQKISKSLGNTVDPIELCEKYGTDVVRYYLLAKVHPWEDTDFTDEKFIEAYNADLANGLGNLVSRIAKLCETNNYGWEKPDDWDDKLSYEVTDFLDCYRFDNALSYVWGWIRGLDQYIEKERPWQKELPADNQRLSINVILEHAVSSLIGIVINLRPFLPGTAERILKQFGQEKIKAMEPLFPRIK